MTKLTAQERNVAPIRLATLEPTAKEAEFISSAMLRDGVVCVHDTLSTAQCDEVSEAILSAQQSLRESNNHPTDQHGAAMLSLFYLPEKELLITGNPRVYRAILQAYRSFSAIRHGEVVDHLTISRPERVNVKLPASPHTLAQHVDLNFFRADAWIPGTRVQGMQVCRIGEYSDNAPNGTLTVVKRFHRYAKLAAIAMHATTGVAGMRSPKDISNDSLHKFLQLPFLPLNAISLYIQFVEAFVGLPGGAALDDLPTDGAVEDKCSKQVSNHKASANKAQRAKPPLVADIRAHARETAEALGLEGCFPVSCEPLGEQPLMWEPISEARSGSLVLWDSLIPHANVSNSCVDTCRVVAYIDLAPIDRPNEMRREDRIARMKALGAGGDRGQSSDNLGERVLAQSGAWARAADLRQNGRLAWTSDGQYAHVHSTGLLLPALYGFDPTTGKRFTWEEYEALDAAN